MDASGSSDPDGDSLTYQWTVTHTDQSTVSVQSIQKPSVTFTKSGSHTIKLTVSDNKGGVNSMSKSVDIDITTDTPVVDPGASTCPTLPTQTTLTHSSDNFNFTVGPIEESSDAIHKFWWDKATASAKATLKVELTPTVVPGQIYNWYIAKGTTSVINPALLRR